MNVDDGLLETAGAAARLTAKFVAKLASSGVSSENAIYEGYKFAEAALRGETEICVHMDLAATIAVRAASAAGIHPDMAKWQREQAREQWKKAENE